ncbi:GPP34 family phosphoprotein [Streptomyces sp. NL15-2K]|uniref:GOLPH3/VPS74 family protein n=1 Tax=Streptomyces sp. NL15-2K TaxID=376149 RepID=UPI000F567908|nr:MULTISPECIES: GPP34 family phosphoprotein [Actinomycetes]WKX06070.1 GPP34 family phosphoprotein [Kutzneria buriramensis]GCB52721.1 hypothetical protein SNL152K_10078 [Streptomyces sp. NL15-2K]
MNTSLADQVMLHIADSTGGRTAAWHTELAIALTGAVLIDLALADHIAIRRNQILINHPGPLDDPVQDEILRRLASRRRPGSVQEWIERLAPLMPDQVQENLLARGLLIPSIGRCTLRLHPRHNSEPPDPPPSEALSRLLHASHQNWTPSQTPSRTPSRTAQPDEPDAVTIVCSAVASCIGSAVQQLMCSF